MNEDTIPFAVAYLVAPVVFLASWAYCIFEYGYLLGVGLGWLPSAIVATIAFAVIRYLWPLVVAALLLVGYLLLK